MALTPEDVVNKRFQQTKFREGYDQDEVDDFLDEIVVELRRLTAENEQLQSALDEANAKLAGQPVQEQQSVPVAAAPQVEAPVVVPPAPVALAKPAETQAPAGENEAESSNSLLQLARRLHDEHVAEGARRRDELVAQGQERVRVIIGEAETKARNITNEGDARARQLVNEAEAKERETIGRLEENKTRLEGRIEELRIFEREYRVKLRSYIEGQLNDLTRQSGSIEPVAAEASQ